MAKLKFFVLFVCVTLFVAGCGKSNPKDLIVGTWVFDGTLIKDTNKVYMGKTVSIDETNATLRDNKMTYVFGKDSSYQIIGIAKKWHGKYTVSDSSLRLISLESDSVSANNPYPHLMENVSLVKVTKQELILKLMLPDSPYGIDIRLKKSEDKTAEELLDERHNIMPYMKP